MYAVVRTGGKQVRVAPGDAIRVEKLDGAIGDRIELEEVLLVGGEGEARIGTPLVEGAKVVGTITARSSPASAGSSAGPGAGCSAASTAVVINTEASSPGGTESQSDAGRRRRPAHGPPRTRGNSRARFGNA